jgi:hypothetical protein
MASKSTPPHRTTLKEINTLIGFLVEFGLADDQNFAFESAHGEGIVSIDYPNAPQGSAILRDEPYVETYTRLYESRAYNIRMLDGALIQMQYEFLGDELRRSRLAFLPSPSLAEFQNDPELYLEDILYADVVDPKVVTVPIRFDYDNRDGVAKSIEHPVAHVTFGQYTNCRIASTGAVSPYHFGEFILRSFYNTASHSVSGKLPAGDQVFARCITDEEFAVVHIGVPCAN